MSGTPGLPLAPENYPPNVSRAKNLVITSSVFYTAALIFYVLRINDRRRRRILRIDDLLLTVSIVSYFSFTRYSMDNDSVIVGLRGILHHHNDQRFLWSRTTCRLLGPVARVTTPTYAITWRRVLCLCSDLRQIIDRMDAEMLHARCQIVAVWTQRSYGIYVCCSDNQHYNRLYTVSSYPGVVDLLIS